MDGRGHTFEKFYIPKRPGRERLRERLCFMEKVEIFVGRGKESMERERLKGQESERLR